KDEQRGSQSATGFQAAHGSLAHTRPARQLLLREAEELAHAACVPPEPAHPSRPVDRRRRRLGTFRLRARHHLGGIEHYYAIRGVQIPRRSGSDLATSPERTSRLPLMLKVSLLGTAPSCYPRASIVRMRPTEGIGWSSASPSRSPPAFPSSPCSPTG